MGWDLGKCSERWKRIGIIKQFLRIALTIRYTSLQRRENSVPLSPLLYLFIADVRKVDQSRMRLYIGERIEFGILICLVHISD